MEKQEQKKTHYLYPGMLFADREEYEVTTILGSCVSVCLWDPHLQIGGINHYLLPLWNGEGLPSPKYGNIAIQKLIEKMLTFGAKRANLKAKMFGGASVLESVGGLLNVGERNIMVGEDILKEERIPVMSFDLGGNLGRKLLYNTKNGTILLRKIKNSKDMKKK